MTPRERVLAVLKGEKPDVIPVLGETPMDITVFESLLPASTGDWIKDSIQRANFFGNSSISTGFSLTQKTISRDKNHHKYQYETGAIWHENYQPTFCREAVHFPINTPDDVLNFEMPDANKPDRLSDDATSMGVKAYKDAGFFVQGSVMGAWQAIYYYLTSFENILMWMAVEPDVAHALFDITTKFSLESAKRMLKAGVDCIFVASDLGSAIAPLFSPAMFKEYVFPWLKELAEICHEKNAYLHLHSHGHIEDLMGYIVESGVDIVNPVGPSDHNDLNLFKRQWGDKIVLHGGISTAINNMTEDEVYDHVNQVISIGRIGGRFLPRTESGIPPMSSKKALHYLKVLKQQCMRGYE